MLTPKKLFHPKSYFFCELKPHAKFQNPTISPSGRKVTRRREEEREITPFPWQRTHPLGPISLIISYLFCYITNQNVYYTVLFISNKLQEYPESHFKDPRNINYVFPSLDKLVSNQNTNWTRGCRSCLQNGEFRALKLSRLESFRVPKT